MTIHRKITLGEERNYFILSRNITVILSENYNKMVFFYDDDIVVTIKANNEAFRKKDNQIAMIFKIIYRFDKWKHNGKHDYTHKIGPFD
jgi:hypothetical protein